MRTLIFWLCLSVSFFSIADNNRVQVTVNNQILTLELAKTPEERALGLQHRKSLCDNCGMVFMFEQSRKVGFWMINTTIPLDIAYVDQDGTIRTIKPLQPLDDTSVSSDVAVKYAWEMNQGWFANNNVAVGDKVTFVTIE